MINEGPGTLEGAVGGSMLKKLEHSEHAEHLAHGEHGAEAGHHSYGAADARRNQMAALLVAVIAAALAVTEQGARHAEIRLEENAIFAADAWSQYQAKSTRGTMSKDLSDIASVMDIRNDALNTQRAKLIERLGQDQERFERDPQDGKGAIMVRAREFEAARDYAREQTHAYHNGAAAMELGIVLATASAIIKSWPLIMMALLLGAAGGVFAILGLVVPEIGAL
jgi:hypothetical protein